METSNLLNMILIQQRAQELLQLISRNEDKLLATMTDTQKELFARRADCV